MTNQQTLKMLYGQFKMKLALLEPQQQADMLENLSVILNQ